MNAGTPFVDYGECGNLTQPYTAELAAFAPPDARAPASPTARELAETIVGQWRPTALLLLMLGAVAVVVLVKRRRVKRPMAN